MRNFRDYFTTYIVSAFENILLLHSLNQLPTSPGSGIFLMRRNSIIKFLITTALFATCLGAMPGQVFAQSKETMDALKIASDNDEAIDSADRQVPVAARHEFGCLLYADFGGSNVLTKTNPEGSKNKTHTANGLMWAIGGQFIYRIHSKDMKLQTSFGAGVELRNLNGTASSTDRFGGTAYDNMHYWYVGLPLSVTISNNKFTAGKNAATGFYATVGLTPSLTANINDVYSVQGVTTTFDTTGHYKNFMLLPNLSAGITCRTLRATYMIGPFVGYTANNLIHNSASVTQHIFSYGLKFTTVFF